MKYFLTKKNLILAAILLLAAVLRFYDLGHTPPGLFLDEASNGYNAYSILKTARDEYGNFMPATFKAFGDYNPALSVYTLVPSIALFGLNNFAVRFPSAILGTLTVLLTYFLTKEILKKFDSIKKDDKKYETLALLSSFFVAISQWHIQFSRYDHEANFMLTFTVIGLILFLKSRKNIFTLSISAIFFGLALNSYHGAKVFIPLAILILLVIFKTEIFSYRKKLIVPFLILFIATLPFLLNFKNSLIRGQSVGILKEKNPATTFTYNYISHFSPSFLFNFGDKNPRHSVEKIGELFVFQIPLIILGLPFLIKSKGKGAKLLLALLLISPIPSALAQPNPHALRSITSSVLWAIISAFGLVELLSINKTKAYKFLTVAILTSVAIYNFITYLHIYYIHYPKMKARDWADGYEEMVKSVDEIKDNYSQIAISNYFGKPYIFVLFYSKFDPKTYQSQSENKNAFDKYEFFSATWKQTKSGKALIVTPPWQSHPKKVIKEIYARNGDLTFTLSETE